jgi:hypothetical protein
MREHFLRKKTVLVLEKNLHNICFLRNHKMQQGHGIFKCVCVCVCVFLEINSARVLQ